MFRSVKISQNSSRINLIKGLKQTLTEPKLLIVNNTEENSKKRKKTNDVIINIIPSDDPENEDKNFKSSSKKIILKTDATNISTKEYDYILPNNALDFVRSRNLNTTHENDTSNGLLTNFKNELKTGFNGVNYMLNHNKNSQIKKYNYNKFIFNQSYQTKLSALNVNLNKELVFQKRLLKLKKNEKLLIEEVDLKKLSKEYNDNFNKKIKEDKKKFVKKASLRHLKTAQIDDKIEKDEKKRQKIELKLLLSLDSKNLSTLRNLKKSKKEDKITLREEFQVKQNVQENIEHQQLIKEAKDKMTNVDKELELIEKIKKNNLKELYPILYRERPHTSRKLITDKKKKFNENFTKITSYAILASLANHGKKVRNVIASNMTNG